MSSFEVLPATPDARATAVARGLWCWPALLPALALALDAAYPLPGGWRVGAGAAHAAEPVLLWLDLAAIACLVWALSGRPSRRGDWRTPLDGRIVAGFVLAVLHVVRTGGQPEPVQWLRQIAASGACFYALSARLRREPRAPDAIWPAFALIVLGLSALVLAQATHGLPAVVQATSWVDGRWVSQHGLAKALLLGTVLCAGRAAEPGARAMWRVTALVGAVSCVVCAFAGGVGLRLASLASLDEPFYFGTTIVAMLFLFGLARMAWELARERGDEAGRWRATALAFPLIAVLLVLGGTTGGEGLRTIAGLAGAAVIAGRASATARARARAATPAAAPAVGPPSALAMPAAPEVKAGAPRAA